MDREKIERTVGDWLAALAEAEPATFGWAASVTLQTSPAYLTDAQTKDGDDYKAGAVSVAICTSERPAAETVEALRVLIVDDRTLGTRAKHAQFERSDDPGEIGIVVVVPR